MTKQVVMVSGAAGNLGAAVARTFLKTGASLVLLDRVPGRLTEEYKDLVGSSSILMLDTVDVTDPLKMQTAVDQALKQFGRIDVLVNTVGTYRGGTPVHETPLETWDLLMNVNVRSVLVSGQAVVPVMLRQGSGNIINVAARGALEGKANMAAYSASKSAVVRLTEGMAAELRPQGIQVNCVLPGTIDTPENREAMPKADHSKWVAPESIARVILFLTSEAASDMHGVAVPVYGRS